MVAAELDVQMCSPLAARRNVMLRGAPILELIGRRVALDCRPSGGDLVTFDGRREAAPCGWMNEILGPGAQPRLRGRGGLRCVPTSSGALTLGLAILHSEFELDRTMAGLKATRKLG